MEAPPLSCRPNQTVVSFPLLFNQTSRICYFTVWMNEWICVLPNKLWPSCCEVVWDLSFPSKHTPTFQILLKFTQWPHLLTFEHRIILMFHFLRYFLYRFIYLAMTGWVYVRVCTGWSKKAAPLHSVVCSISTSQIPSAFPCPRRRP
jgi:hypothetical protein